MILYIVFESPGLTHRRRLHRPTDRPTDDDDDDMYSRTGPGYIIIIIIILLLL